jgi:hypothetical protein
VTGDRGGQDRFGLPLHWTLLGETDAEWHAREMAVHDLIRDVFKAASHHLGEDAARQAFKDHSRRPQARPPKRFFDSEDLALLAEYDRRARGVSAQELKALPASLSREWQQGQSPSAVEKHLRRLLQKRQDNLNRDRNALKAAGRWPPVPSLLGDAGQK